MILLLKGYLCHFSLFSLPRSSRSSSSFKMLLYVVFSSLSGNSCLPTPLLSQTYLVLTCRLPLTVLAEATSSNPMSLTLRIGVAALSAFCSDRFVVYPITKLLSLTRKLGLRVCFFNVLALYSYCVERGMLLLVTDPYLCWCLVLS